VAQNNPTYSHYINTSSSSCLLQMMQMFRTLHGHGGRSAAHAISCWQAPMHAHVEAAVQLSIRFPHPSGKVVLLLGKAEELHLEDEGGIGGDDTPGSMGAIPVVRGDGQLGLLAL